MTRWSGLLVGAAVLAVACAGGEETAEPSPSRLSAIELDADGRPDPDIEPSDPVSASASTGEVAEDDVRLGFEGRADIDATGNRVSTGTGDLSAEPIEIRLDQPAIWLVPSSPERGAPWAAVLDDGRLVWIDPRSGEVDVLVEDWGDAEPVVRGAERIDTWDLASLFPDALPDGRLVSGRDVAVFLAEPTDRYRHGVLGDVVEAAAIEIRSTEDGSSEFRVELDVDVVEGRSALLGDADGDGDDEILVTQSNDRNGARLVLYDADGTLLAESTSVGRGNRWRSQLAIAPVGPDGEIEIVDVRTPHLGRTIEWFRLEGDELVRVAERDGYTNHVLGSRNLDLGIVADPDGDGRLEVVVPTSDRRAVGVVARTAAGTDEEFRVDLGARLSSNLGAIDHPDGGATYAIGTEDGRIRFWVS
ncbi:MAG: hypothetical protein AAGA90_07190 [Actinomycetota bacterium]